MENENNFSQHNPTFSKLPDPRERRDVIGDHFGAGLVAVQRPMELKPSGDENEEEVETENEEETSAEVAEDTVMDPLDLSQVEEESEEFIEIHSSPLEVDEASTENATMGELVQYEATGDDSEGSIEYEDVEMLDPEEPEQSCMTSVPVKNEFKIKPAKKAFNKAPELSKIDSKVEIVKKKSLAAAMTAKIVNKAQAKTVPKKSPVKKAAKTVPKKSPLKKTVTAPKKTSAKTTAKTAPKKSPLKKTVTVPKKSPLKKTVTAPKKTPAKTVPVPKKSSAKAVPKKGVKAEAKAIPKKVAKTTPKKSLKRPRSPSPEVRSYRLRPRR